MSTRTKLDRNVRLDRYLRKMALRDLEWNVMVTTKKLAEGTALLHSAPTLLRFRVISQLTLKHLRKVHKDPRRSGEAKEAIFVKLGAEPTERPQ